MYAKVENLRLLYIQQNHQTLSSEKNRRNCEDIATDNNQYDVRTGRKFILPPSITGRPRYLHQHVQNAIAVANDFHKPDIFNTYTYNPLWPEIAPSSFPKQQPHERSDNVAWVIYFKWMKLMYDLLNCNFMGRWAGNMKLVEFQRRGQQNSNILFTLKELDILHTAQEFDQFMTAKLTPDAEAFPDGPQRDQARRLVQSVVTYMTHNCTDFFRQHGSQWKKATQKTAQQFNHWDDNAFYPINERWLPGVGGRAISIKNKIISTSG